ncbi:MAG: S-methyl-5'-thioadenosine phosphorylase [Anaerolineae bacterium]|nr:S-methyl-5'-thioadenosine phosphorylase [Anaerolineae bacterium]
MEPVRIAVIGGSGLYHMPEVTDVEEHRISTPFGAPSDSIVIGTLRGQRVAFLPRHGRGHVLTPSEVPYRANIYALKTLGVTHVIAVSACGSLREELEPGHIVIPDQLFDYTKNERGRSFFGNGLVGHIGVANPFCPVLSKVLAEASRQAGSTVHEGGTSITIEGPRFSTRGESAVWRQFGFSIIGMTTCPEAFLAREAEMHYAVMAHVTDYDVWHIEHVNADVVFKRFQDNIAQAQHAVAETVARIDQATYNCECESALSVAFATHRDRISPQVLEPLLPIVGKYFKG